MAAPRPTRRSFIKRLFGIEGVGVELAAIVPGSGTYTLPATPIANPTITVTNANIKKDAIITVAINDPGGLTDPITIIVNTPTSDGGFTFDLDTSTGIPSDDILYSYIAINSNY